MPWSLFWTLVIQVPIGGLVVGAALLFVRSGWREGGDKAPNA